MSADKKEVEYKEFCTQWAKAVSGKDPMAIWQMNLNVLVKCRNCNNLVNGEDTVQGIELYCPNCHAGWVVRAK